VQLEFFECANSLHDIDSLRADYVSAYRYHGETTPNIDRLAEDGV